MKKYMRKVWMILFIFTLCGCGEISKAQYEALVQQYNSVKAQLDEADANMEASDNAREMEANAALKKIGELQGHLDQANQENAKLKSDVVALKAKLKDLEWQKLRLELKMDKLTRDEGVTLVPVQPREKPKT